MRKRHGNMKQDHDMSNLLSINVVVSILAYLYGHQYRTDTPTVHYTPYTLVQPATYDKHKVPNIVPFLTAGHIYLVFSMNDVVVDCFVMSTTCFV